MCTFGGDEGKVLIVNNTIPFRCDADATLIHIDTDASPIMAVFSLEKAHEFQCNIFAGVDTGNELKDEEIELTCMGMTNNCRHRGR